MYKSFTACFLSLFVFIPKASANLISSNKSCHEQFHEITVPEIQKIFSNKENYIKYGGQEGYLLFAIKSPNINSMNDLFILAARALGLNFNKLDWKKYPGLLEDFLKEKEQILDENGNLREEYKTKEGYAVYTEKYHGKDMSKAFKHVSAVLNTELFEQLGWQRYYSSSEEFRAKRTQILNENGNIKEKYITMEGLVKYATKYHGKDMLKAFINVSAILDKSVFQQLDWRTYSGSVQEFRKEQRNILDKAGNPKGKYKTRDGYILYSQQYHKGSLSKTFANISAILGGHKAMRDQGFEWIIFKGAVPEYRKLIQMFKNYQITDLEGPEGQRKVAVKVFQGNNKRAYENVSALREVLLGGRGAFNELKWSGDLK